MLNDVYNGHRKQHKQTSKFIDCCQQEIITNQEFKSILIVQEIFKKKKSIDE